MKQSIKIGTASWNIPATSKQAFPGDGTHLKRYASVFTGVEINSTFYRSHQSKTFERWAASTPRDFRFAVKMPKIITHEQRLNVDEALLNQFLSEIEHLGERLGPLLVQLSPSLVFNTKIALGFLDLLRRKFTGGVALEPRHASWFRSEVEKELIERKIARVKADPAKPAAAAETGGWNGLVYYRLHGSPRIYWSNYPTAYLEQVSDELQMHRKAGVDAWCVFDNTAQGFATTNALAVKELIERDLKHETRLRDL